MTEFYAHSADGKYVDILSDNCHSGPDPESIALMNILKGTAELAKTFASEFGCGEWAYLAGLWHDIGKYA